MDPGTAIRCETSKWGDRPHWQFDGFFLGSDEHGDWLGFPAGTHNHRPGHEFHSDVDCVTLVQPGRWHLPTFQAPGIWCDLYVDVTTPAVWEGERAPRGRPRPRRDPAAGPPPARGVRPLGRPSGRAGRGLRRRRGRVRRAPGAYGYPADVVAAAQASCDALVPAVRAGLPPYDGTHQRWLAELTRLTSA